MNTQNGKPSLGEWTLKFVLPPILIISLTLFGASFAVEKFKLKEEKKEPQPLIPPVEIVVAQQETIKTVVDSQGTVVPRIQTLILAEVSGRIESVSPTLYSGGFFKKGEALATIESLDYEAQLATALSQLADAKLAFAQEKANAAQAEDDWNQISSNKEANDLTLRRPQLERAKANLIAVTTNVEIAQRNLDRTKITAPYDGRIQEKFVDIGQFVNARSSQIARIFATNAIEVRLPISLDDALFINIPKTGQEKGKPQVTLKSKQSTGTLTWAGVIDRSEGSIDPQSRLLHLVAQVNDPYALAAENTNTQLEVGRFVDAEIQGLTIENAFRLPRKTLRSGNRLYIINDEDRVEIRTVDVFKKNESTVIITGGLESGDRISLTNLEYAIDGMQVTIQSDAASEPTGEEAPPTESDETASQASL